MPNICILLKINIEVFVFSLICNKIQTSEHYSISRVITAFGS